MYPIFKIIEGSSSEVESELNKLQKKFPLCQIDVITMAVKGDGLVVIITYFQ